MQNPESGNVLKAENTNSLSLWPSQDLIVTAGFENITNDKGVAIENVSVCKYSMIQRSAQYYYKFRRYPHSYTQEWIC